MKKRGQKVEESSASSEEMKKRGKKVGESSTSSGSYPYKPPPASIQSHIPSTIPNQKYWKNSVSQQRPPPAKIIKKWGGSFQQKNSSPKMDSSPESRSLAQE
ncbi:hypothetical protein CDAR_276061 [Caerostris darwini]|uniref:Uncharacterized protein n=1 Tax=Caerostris darwini TaxID=1538125 RepID=A0AAV4QK65_9ARAC|nr:hypothetical protein CDAR_276061 [Caerostris darwini]